MLTPWATTFPEHNSPNRGGTKEMQGTGGLDCDTLSLAQGFPTAVSATCSKMPPAHCIGLWVGYTASNFTWIKRGRQSISY